MKLVVTNPNLSVIMPGGCNAKCEFCYWKGDEGLTLNRFSNVASTLPEIFKQCSITGGEPTLNKNLYEYLSVAKNRFEKVVLNTNGSFLRKEYIKLVNHVNISRHHYDDRVNETIFKTLTVPNTSTILKFCEIGDITLNCYLPDKFDDMKFINKYVDYARFVGAKVAFRKHYNNLNLLDKVDLNDTLIDEHSCGACMQRYHVINGVDVTFKYSVQETCEVMGGIYELILQANGDLTFDWSGKNKLTYGEV